jgi:hypothetical protein
MAESMSFATEMMLQSAVMAAMGSMTWAAESVK